MPADPNIGTREREILTAIVETFISTGEPVGSRTLARLPPVGEEVVLYVETQWSQD